MKTRNSTVTIERFRELLTYDPESGEFRRLVRKPKAPIGSVAGCIAPDGYQHIMIDYMRYKAHRLAWFVMTGSWPQGDIDHIDGDPGNNRFANLRDATVNENMQNRRRANRNNRGGLLGTSWHKAANKWRADIVLDHKQTYLGLFETAEDAHAAYLTAKRQMHPAGML